MTLLSNNQATRRCSRSNMNSSHLHPNMSEQTKLLAQLNQLRKGRTNFKLKEEAKGVELRYICSNRATIRGQENELKFDIWESSFSNWIRRAEPSRATSFISFCLSLSYRPTLTTIVDRQISENVVPTFTPTAITYKKSLISLLAQNIYFDLMFGRVVQCLWRRKWGSMGQADRLPVRVCLFVCLLGALLKKVYGFSR